MDQQQTVKQNYYNIGDSNNSGGSNSRGEKPQLRQRLFDCVSELRIIDVRCGGDRWTDNRKTSLWVPVVVRAFSYRVGRGE